MVPAAEFHRILQLGNRNLLLFAVSLAIAMGIRFPLSQEMLHAFNFTTPLVAIIFLAQGLNMNFSHANKIRTYLRIIIAGAILAVIAYPALAHTAASLFTLKDDLALGFILICCFPNSLEAAMAMSMNASGDRITAVVLLVGLSLIGIISIPLNIYIWIGETEQISASIVLTKIIGYIFIPITIGQLLRKVFPKLPDKTKTLSHYVPIFCLAALVYLSCSREAEVIRQLHLGDLIHTFFPCASLHLFVLITALVVGKHILHLPKADNRSFIFIISEKPMSLSVALWSVTYAASHPTSIFPILVFYIGQMVIDSFIISRMKLRDYLEQK
ncbi:bile acid:sodium symporter [Halodesulfovibrio marinisediminis]|uniref:Solute carrier family 10 (Sodium/bile acid cotransporter), member 7 n=1 Tax=Halodesulfovibrio marinisediminis DSM 17456 TaxID=1121457 RepID=A0A1N6IGY8_9BACT|nr:bile acid:sodium symporter [Halodesulfovibrio marinisediminis]SIO31297.1 solute carrier family 10 (sodium/bile acid cotransporter), member 7 [Halodesulfovibrio marinisediminis DSM 17456]